MSTQEERPDSQAAEMDRILKYDPLADFEAKSPPRVYKYYDFIFSN